MNNYQVNQTIDNEYTIKRSESVQKQLTKKDKFIWRQQHDYYVNKYKESLSTNISLSEKELNQYGLAILREKQQLVKPLIMQI